MTAVFNFDEASHTYTLDGVRLPSVTQLLAPIKPDFSMVPPDVLEAKRALGVAVHTACEIDDQGELDDEGTDPVVMRYVAAWRLFRTQTAATILANERRLYHPTLRFAGTVDRAADISTGRGSARDLWILDLKTGDEPHASYGVQLAGYEALLRANDERISPDLRLRRGTVHLRDDGTYRLHEFKNPNDSAAFMACLSLHAWKEANQ